MAAQNPKQRGEIKQVICRRRAAGDEAPWPSLERLEALVSYNTPNYFTDARGDCHRDVQWCTVAVHALEVQRYFPGPAGRIVALSRDDIVTLIERRRQNPQVFTAAEVAADPVFPAVQRASRYSLLQALVTWNDDTLGQVVRRFDIGGGFTASFPTSNVTVEVLLPPEFESVSDSSSVPQVQRGGVGSEVDPADGIILDTIVEGSVTMACSGVGKRSGRCTYPVIMAPNTDYLVEAPPGVRGVFVNAPAGVTAGFETDPVVPYGVTFPINDRVPMDGTSRYVRVNNGNGAIVQARVIFELEF